MPDLRVKIMVYQQDGTIVSQYLLGEGEHAIGRDPNSAIYCESPHVSNDHAKLHLSDEGIFIEDLNSTSGTFLDQINVRGKVRLTPGQRLQVGDLHIDLQLEGVGDLSPGVKIGAGRYQLNKELGRGAMGQVWLAQDTQLDELVAIKVLPSDVANDAVCLLDLKREVQKSRKLSQDNIIRIHDLVQLPGENPFVSLEYVEGTDLHAIQVNQPDRIFSWQEVKPYVMQLCDALDYAHERKIVHRDLKPANIMITHDGVLKLADFGIAASIVDATGRSSMADIISGTPQFMSPQQMLGESPKASDDIYALGATMYCLLTGRPPFHTGDIAQQAQHVTPAPLEQRLREFGLENEVPGYVNDVVMSCLAKDPTVRPASAGAIGEWLRTGGKSERPAERKATETGIERIVAEKPVETAVEPSVEEQTTQAQPTQEQPTVVQAQNAEEKKSPILAIAASIIVVAGLGWFFMGGSGDDQENANLRPADKGTGNTDGTQQASVTPNSPKVEAAIEAAIRMAAGKPTGEITQADLDKVTRLDLQANHLTEAPKGLEKLKKLEGLVLYNNQLTNAAGLENLTQLKGLELGNNQLTNVTDLEKLTQLRELNLASNNHPTKLPEGLEKLTQLTSLHLPDNQLNEAPESLEKLTGLKFLKLAGNQLTDVKGLEKLMQLKELWLDNNQLTDLTGLEKLTQLEYLNLKDNPDLTKAQIAQLQKALPECKFEHNANSSSLKEGLVAYYPFNGNTNDESGNGNDGEVKGAALSEDRHGNSNNAYSFDGEDDNIEVKSISHKDFRSCTLSAWAHYTTLPNEKEMYGQIVCMNGECHFICVDGTRKQIYMRHGCRTVGCEFYDAPASNEWRHFTLSWDHTTKAVRYFINGKKAGEHKVYTERGVDQAHLMMGSTGPRSSLGIDQFFKGSIDDVRIYNRALSDEEVSALYDLEKPKTDLKKGLVAYYPFNGNANDESGNGHDGEVKGASVTTDRHGKQNQAYDFSGNPKSSIRSGKSVNATLKTLTLSAWVYLNKQSQNQPEDVISWPGASHLLIPPMDGDKPTFGVRPDLESWKNLQHPDGLPSSKWFMYTGIYDGKELALYIDGKKVATTDYSAGIYDGEEGPIWIGRNYQPFLPTINGKVDDVRIYNRALSADEITDLYDLEKPSSETASGTKKPGTLLWEFETGDPVASHPAIGPDGTVYVGSNDKKVYALDGKTGAKKWEFETGGLLYSSPAIGPDGTLYFGSTDKKVYAINGKSGEKKWEFITGHAVASSPAIGSDGTIYIGSNDKKVYALNSRSGAMKWEFETGAIVWSSPAIGSDGTIYVGSTQPDNKVYALDGKTGAKKWEFQTGYEVSSSPAIGADGTIYVGSWDAKVYALDGATGAKKWEFKTGDNAYPSPAIGSDGTVYAGSWDKRVYALNGKTGAKKWEFLTGNWVASSPAIGSDGTIYVGSKDKKLYALDGATGTKKWEFLTGDQINSSPVIGADGTVYVGSNDGKVYALATSSKGPAKSPWPMFGQNAQHTGRASATPISPEQSALVEKKLREALQKPTGELTQADKLKLTSFGGHGWQINAEGLREVAKLKNLTYLVLNASPTTDAGLEEVAKLQKLTALHLGRGTKISDAGLKHVAKLQKLTTLELHAAHVTDKGLKEVAKLHNLTYLGMADTKITDEGLKELVMLQKLYDLPLNDTQITDAGLKEIGKMKQLTKLDLRSTNVTAAGVAELQKALPKCKITHDAGPVIGAEIGSIGSYDPKFGFYVVDRGADHGIKKGDEFSVSRAGKFVGKIRIKQVQPTVSIAEAIKELTPQKLQAGDKVRKMN